MSLKNIIKNKILIYMASRYIVYFIQFLTTLLIAAKLGPYYMGIWGFLLLLINYFAQLHFGIANSLNVLMVQHKEEPIATNNYIANSLILTGYLSAFVAFFYLYYVIFGIPIFEKYHAGRFFFWICLIGILQYVNMIVINIFRVKNMLNHVTFSQSIIILINFIGVICFKGELLITYLIGGYLAGNTLILMLSLLSRCIPRLKDIEIVQTTQWRILKKGLLLFLYNSCFFFIILSIKTIVSNYYSVEEFGMFAFSFSLGQAVMLLIGAFSFVIFPKLIDNLSSPDVNSVKKTIKIIRSGYITTAHIIVYAALTIFPFLLHFLPQYEGAIVVLNLIALTTLLDANSFGYSTLLIARDKEKTSACISFCSLIINVAFGLFLAKIIHVSFSYVIFATMITYFLFCLAVVKCGSKVIGIKGWTYTLKNFFPFKLMISYLLAILVSVFQTKILLPFPLIICVCLNLKEIKQILLLIRQLMVKPNLIDV